MPAISQNLSIFLAALTLLILFLWYFATEIERRKRTIGSILLVVITSLCLLAITPPKEKLKGGIDILGGSSFTLRVQPRENADGSKQSVSPQEVDQAIKVIEKRLNGMGTAEPLIARQGSDRIIVQMPGVEPAESKAIRATLEQVAKLELREVSPRNDELGADRKTLAARVNEGLDIVPGYRAYQLKGKNAEGVEYSVPILLNRRAALGGSDISRADATGIASDAVSITLNSGGEDKMIALTKDMRKGVDRIAIVLDGEVLNAPVVQSQLGKQFEVTGLHEAGEAKKLAEALMNPLENPLVVEEERSVSPTLGSAVVKQGLLAGGLALLLTFAFVLLYYRVSGFIAIIGLLVNTLLLFGLMAMFGFTFSLPGIAGMILTIGMAVDANVLIYERLREEIAHGKALKNAISASYDKAFTAIFDANITSLITAAILFWLGSSAIKGFAVTLIIGIVASMFSAILVTRVLFRWGTDLNILKKLTFLNLIRARGFDFMGKRRLAISIALGLVAISIVGFAVRKEKALGIDFTGGTRIQFQLGKGAQVSTQEVDDVLKGLHLGKTAYPQQETNAATGTLLTVRCDSKDTETITARLREAIPVLSQKTPEGKYLIDASKEEVSALIGGDFFSQSLIALGLGLLGIMIYMTIRFEFSFAIGGFVAILHDIVISIGIIVLLGGELSLIHVGAILTIAGYSINDTIIVFDRIRESFHLRRGGSTEEIMNEAINATLSRTILTSGATLISVSILAFLGGASLRDFGLVIFIGIVVGTFSSIFIASPVVLWWSSRKGQNLRDTVLTKELKETAVEVLP